MLAAGLVVVTAFAVGQRSRGEDVAAEPLPDHLMLPVGQEAFCAGAGQALGAEHGLESGSFTPGEIVAFLTKAQNLFADASSAEEIPWVQERVRAVGDAVGRLRVHLIAQPDDTGSRSTGRLRRDVTRLLVSMGDQCTPAPTDPEDFRESED